MAAFAADPSRVVLVGRANDRFGDNGLITVAVARVTERAASGRSTSRPGS